MKSNRAGLHTQHKGNKLSDYFEETHYQSKTRIAILEEEVKYWQQRCVAVEQALAAIERERK